MSGIRKRALQENERVRERKLEEGIPQTTNHVCVYAYIAISQQQQLPLEFIVVHILSQVVRISKGIFERQSMAIKYMYV